MLEISPNSLNDFYGGYPGMLRDRTFMQSDPKNPEESRSNLANPQGWAAWSWQFYWCLGWWWMVFYIFLQAMHVKSPRTWFVQAVSIYTEVGGWVVLECFACFRAIFVKDIGQRGFLSCLNLNNYNNGLPKQQATQSDFKLIQIIWNLFPPFLQVWVCDSQKPVLVSQLVLRLAQVRSFFSLDPSVDSVPWEFWAVFNVLSCNSRRLLPSREPTYPTLGKGKSSTQNWLFWGYVSSQEGTSVILRVFDFDSLKDTRICQDSLFS